MQTDFRMVGSISSLHFPDPGTNLPLNCMCDLTRAVPTFEAHPKGGTGGLELDAGARVSAGPRGVLIIARSVSAFCFVFAPVSLSRYHPVFSESLP